ncbi:MAG: hypothetical protein JWP81_2183 [Ferruginibacter sp.]|nr:hypothetical protein [Ferruginibacter sp.]
MREFKKAPRKDLRWSGEASKPLYQEGRVRN